EEGVHVILSWYPHCDHCYYCDRGLPILCEDYLAKGAQAVKFEGASKARRASGEELKHLMFIGAFGEYCIVQEPRFVRRSKRCGPAARRSGSPRATSTTRSVSAGAR